MVIVRAGYGELSFVPFGNDGAWSKRGIASSASPAIYVVPMSFRGLTKSGSKDQNVLVPGNILL